MANRNEDSPKAFLIYESTFNQLKKHFTPAQAGEFLMLMGEYMLNENKDVESEDPMVDLLLQMNKPILTAAEKRHRQAVENGMKGAEYGKNGGAPKGNQNARKKKEGEKQPQNNPQSTPNQPLKKEIENNKEKEKQKENKININTNIEKEEALFSDDTCSNGVTCFNVENGYIESFEVEGNQRQPEPNPSCVESQSSIEERIQRDVQLIVAMQEERIDDRDYHKVYQRALSNYSNLYGVSSSRAETEISAMVRRMRLEHLGK